MLECGEGLDLCLLVSCECASGTEQVFLLKQTRNVGRQGALDSIGSPRKCHVLSLERSRIRLGGLIKSSPIVVLKLGLSSHTAFCSLTRGRASVFCRLHQDRESRENRGSKKANDNRRSALPSRGHRRVGPRPTLKWCSRVGSLAALSRLPSNETCAGYPHVGDGWHRISPSIRPLIRIKPT